MATLKAKITGLSLSTTSLVFGFRFSNLVESRLDLALQLTALDLGAWVALEVSDVLDRHLDDLRLLDAAPALL